VRFSFLLSAAALALLLVAGASLRGQLRDEPVTSGPLELGRAGEPAPPADGAVARAGRSPRNASYDIEVRLDHDARTLEGRQTIHWRNIDAAPVSDLQFHLYWNAWRDRDSTWLRERRLVPGYTLPEDGWSAIEITSLRIRQPEGDWADVLDRLRFIAPDDGNQADRTVAAVPLDSPIGSGLTLEIEIAWTATIPRPFARTGYIDDYYFIAQWFPKLGVFEDGAWNVHQFHTATEFYADFGVYDVAITVPDGFVVGASGQQVERVEHDDATTTHRYRGEDIHDFAWTASPRLLDLTRRFEHPALPAVEMRLLLQPEHEDQADRYFAITEATLARYGEWFGAYPYGYLTIVDPAFQSGSGGMEYPTLFTGGTRWLAPADVQQPESVTAHEAGHQWWHGMVASNEAEHAWIDEGFNTFATARVLDEAFPQSRRGLRLFGGFVPWVLRDVPLTRIDHDRLASYRLNAEADEPWTPTYRYWPATAGAITYDKTALWLHTLERHLGWPVLQRILATFFERWQFRHPTPGDFFDVVTEVTGQNYFWFFDEVYRSSNTFDYGVEALRSETDGDDAHRTTVVVRRHGEARFPVEVVTTFEDGEQVREAWDGLDRRVIYEYTRDARALSVQVDPDRVLLLDVDYTNNSRTLEPRAEEAARKWSLTWMVWLQDLMLTYGFFL